MPNKREIYMLRSAPARLAAVLLVALCAGPAIAQDFTLSTCSRGDWASYLVTTQDLAAPALSSKDQPRLAYVAEVGPDFVELRSEAKVASSVMRSGDTLNSTLPYEPIKGISGASVKIVSSSRESLSIRGRSFDCIKTVRDIDQAPSLGVPGWKGRSTIWTSAAMPIGLVRMENDFASALGAGSIRKYKETWVASEFGFKERTEGVAAGPAPTEPRFAQGQGASAQGSLQAQTGGAIAEQAARADAYGPILEAIQADDVEALKKLEAKGLDPSSFTFTNSSGGQNLMGAAITASMATFQEKSLLMAAADAGSLEVVRHLVEERKVPVNRRSKTTTVDGKSYTDIDPEYGRTALFYACTEDMRKAGPEKCARKAQVAAYLLAHGAGPDLRYRLFANSCAWEELLVACIGCQDDSRIWKGTVRALLSAKANPNGMVWITNGKKDDKPQITTTALMTAAKGGTLDDVRALVEAGAALDTENMAGGNAHTLAAKRAAESAVGKAILAYLESRGAKMSTLEELGGDAKAEAARKGAAEQRQMDATMAKLPMACMSSPLDKIKPIVEGGADVNAVVDGKLALVVAVQGSRLDIAEYLVSKGADLQGADGGKLTALQWAAMGGNPALVKWLLAKGADPNFTKNGISPLCFAKNSKKREVVDLLVAAGAR